MPTPGGPHRTRYVGPGPGRCRRPTRTGADPYPGPHANMSTLV